MRRTIWGLDLPLVGCLSVRGLSCPWNQVGKAASRKGEGKFLLFLRLHAASSPPPLFATEQAGQNGAPFLIALRGILWLMGLDFNCGGRNMTALISCVSFPDAACAQ
jgi:hypothetical protein